MNPSNQKGKVDTSADAVAAGTGGVAGAAAGAAIGSLAGPIGTIIGGLAGAVGGWWSGRAIGEAATRYTTDDDANYQQHYMDTSRSTGGSLSRSNTSYDTARPAYQLGHLAGMNPDYRGRAFEDVEPHLSSAYASAGRNDWHDVRDYARDAYGRGRDLGEQRLTLAEEQLRVGERTVQAGEVDAQRLTGNLEETARLTNRERNLRSGASGLADRIADSADDVKDRFDGNPASRPGRDATDRPGR